VPADGGGHEVVEAMSSGGIVMRWGVFSKRVPSRVETPVFLELGVDRLREIGEGRVASAGEDGGHGREAEVGEDSGYGLGLGENGDEIEAAIAARTCESINVVDSFEECGPLETGKP